LKGGERKGIIEREGEVCSKKRGERKNRERIDNMIGRSGI
jgi:hypothetical protein